MYNFLFTGGNFAFKDDDDHDNDEDNEQDWISCPKFANTNIQIPTVYVDLFSRLYYNIV